MFALLTGSGRHREVQPVENRKATGQPVQRVFTVFGHVDANKAGGGYLITRFGTAPILRRPELEAFTRCCRWKHDEKGLAGQNHAGHLDKPSHAKRRARRRTPCTSSARQHSRCGTL